MEKYKYLNDVYELVISSYDNGEYYLEPDYQYILETQNLWPSNKQIAKIVSCDKLKEMLYLEVKKRNAKEDKTKQVVKFIAEILLGDQGIEGLFTQEDNKLLENLLQYMAITNIDKKKESAIRKDYSIVK